MKKYIVVFTTVLAVAAFAAATFFYQKTDEARPPVTQAVAKTEEDSLIRPHSPILGPVNASVTIVEFLDPSCEACRAFFPVVEELRKSYPEDIRVVLRYAAFHQGSDEAVGILEAARKQELFEPVLQALFEQQPQWAIHGAPNLSRAWDIAAAHGLDVTRAKTDAAAPEIKAILAQDKADIQTHNVRQTPTFFINGKRLMSAGQEKLRRLVTAEVQRSKGIEPTQTAPPLRKIEGKFVCMMDNRFMGREQVAAEIEGKTYYGCTGAVRHLQMSAPTRMATDPVSGRSVDKATAVLGADEDGQVYYFENEENLKKFTPP